MANQKYDPFKHHRQSIRLSDWDYRTPGYYFVTICTFQRENLFADASLKEVASVTWQAIPDHKKAKHIALDEWVVMPNHIHGLLWLQTWPATIRDEPVKKQGFSHAQAGSAGATIGSFKSQAARKINNLRRKPKAKVWQAGYWDRIVRNEEELNNIRRYIIDNPAKWAEDNENLDNLLNKMTHHP